MTDLVEQQAAENGRLRAELADGRAQYANLRKAFDDTLAILTATATERGALKAASGRAFEKIAEIYDEIDEFEQRHNPECECETIPAVRETLSRIDAALAVPESANVVEECEFGAGCICHATPETPGSES